MITAPFLCKDLRLDWRLGAGTFSTGSLTVGMRERLSNWQWVTGRATTRPPLNPIRQAERVRR